MSMGSDLINLNYNYHSPMTSRSNKVKTTMYPGVRDDLLTYHTILLIKVQVKLVIDVVQNGYPTRVKIWLNNSIFFLHHLQ